MKSRRLKKTQTPGEPIRKPEQKEKGPKFLVKFEISSDNIACFMQQREANMDKVRKKTQSKRNSHQKKNPSIKKKIPNTAKIVQRKSCSPDLIREYSNTILSQIQKEGLKCQWTDGEIKSSNHNNVLEEYQSQALKNIFSLSHEKSHASTIAPHSNWQNQSFTLYPNYSYESTPTHRSVSFTSLPYSSSQSSFLINPKSPIPDFRTTLMIRNIPNKYTIQQLAEQIDSQHDNTYDFLYLPCDPKNLCNVGYGFINFVNTEELKRFYEKFEGYIWLKYRSEKICALTYARLQGLTQLIEHFENSKVLNQKDRRYKPIIKYNNTNDYHQIHKMVREQQQKRQ